MLHHIEIYVSDLQRSRQFYNWFFAWLGYELSSDWNEGFSYRFDNSYYLVFVQTEPQHLHHIYHRKQTGLNHLAFAAASREKVDELTQLLIAKGIPILYADKHPFAGGKHYYAVFFEDPDRIKLEVAVRQ
jgi:catechol 2,3-dioxygenase-like lactoylglutathione lyase family enzyme